MDESCAERLRHIKVIEAEIAAEVSMLVPVVGRAVLDRNDRVLPLSLVRLSVLQARLTSLVAQGPAVLLGSAPGPGLSQLALAWAGISHRASRLGQLIGLLSGLGQREAVPLYHPRRRPTDPVWAQRDVLDRALMRLTNVLNPTPQDASAAARGAYPDIPIAPTDFVAHLHAAMRVSMALHGLRKIRFLDVGCGSGLTLLIASEIFHDAEGIDLDPGYIASAAEVLRRAGVRNGRVERADALTFDRFDAFEVIYFYRPLRDDVLLEQMERRIAAQARPGTLLIAPYSQFDQRSEGYGCAHVAGRIFVTGIEPEEAAGLRIKAEMMGSAFPPAESAPNPQDDYLGPLVRACQAIGLDIR